MHNWTQEQLREAEARLGQSTVLPKPPKVKRPQMNKWEEQYAVILEAQRRNGEILWYGFEAMRLRLGEGTWYKPDFCVMRRSGLQVVEIKGFMREAARVRFNVAAELFPFSFLMLRKQRVKEGGGWEVLRSIDRGIE